MTPFNLDLLHPGQFARNWLDWLASPRKLAIAFAVGALLILGVVGYAYRVTAALEAEERSVEKQRKALETQIPQRRNDLTRLRNLFEGISELERLQIAWSEVLPALSEAISPEIWLNRLTLLRPEAKPVPKAEQSGQPPSRAPQVFRLELATELRPGKAPFVAVAKVLDALGQDPRFSRKFRLEDWEASSSAISSGEEAREQMTVTVTFRELP